MKFSITIVDILSYIAYRYYFGSSTFALYSTHLMFYIPRGFMESSDALKWFNNLIIPSDVGE